MAKKLTTPQPLRQTNDLMARYGKRIISGEITDEELAALINPTPSPFSKSPGYVNPSAPVSDSNFSQLAGMQNLAQILGAQLNEEQLHALNVRLLNIAREALPDGEKNAFLRKSTFEKVMLSYELFRNPKKMEEHFNSTESIRTVFCSSPNEAINKSNQGNLKEVILAPGVAYFNDESDKLFEEQQKLVSQAPTKNFTAPSVTVTDQEVAHFNSKLREVPHYYKYAANSPEQGRKHPYEVAATGLKNELQGLKGDHLKSVILKDFKTQLERCQSKDELMAKVKDIKENSPEYKILATGQGWMTQKLGLTTSSVRAFNNMVEDAKTMLEAKAATRPSA